MRREFPPKVKLAAWDAAGGHCQSCLARIPMERFLRVLTTAVQTIMASNFTNLLECDRRSLWQAAMKAAQDGLIPDGREGAIIKYGDKAQKK